MPGGPLGAEQRGDLDLDHTDDAVDDVTASNSARTTDTTRTSTTPPATAWSSSRRDRQSWGHLQALQEALVVDDAQEMRAGVGLADAQGTTGAGEHVR